MSTIPTIQSVVSVATPFSALLLDAYGVFWGGMAKGPFPGSSQAMAYFVQKNKIVGILSNATQSIEGAEASFQKRSIIKGTHYHFLITSGAIANKIFHDEQLPFATPNKKYFLLGTPHPNFSPPQSIFQNTPYTQTHSLEKADFIYIAIPHINGQDQETADGFRDIIHTLQSSRLPMVCTNPDKFAHEGDPPRRVVRQGTIAGLYEEIGGSVIYIGKPNGSVYEAAMKVFHTYGVTTPSQILMIGDTPEADIRGARAFGMLSALTTNTGMMGEEVAKYGLDTALQHLLPTDRPDFLIEKFSMPMSDT